MVLDSMPMLRTTYRVRCKEAIILNGELKEYSTVFLKEYGINACVVDKHWREDMNKYLYCLELASQ